MANNYGQGFIRTRAAFSEEFKNIGIKQFKLFSRGEKSMMPIFPRVLKFDDLPKSNHRAGMILIINE